MEHFKKINTKHNHRHKREVNKKENPLEWNTEAKVILIQIPLFQKYLKTEQGKEKNKLQQWRVNVENPLQ